VANASLAMPLLLGGESQGAKVGREKESLSHLLDDGKKGKRKREIGDGGTKEVYAFFPTNNQMRTFFPFKKEKKGGGN